VGNQAMVCFWRRNECSGCVYAQMDVVVDSLMHSLLAAARREVRGVGGRPSTLAAQSDAPERSVGTLVDLTRH